MKKIQAGSFSQLPVSPVVLIGANVKGKANYAAVAFISAVNINPPIVGVSINKRHYTTRGIIENETFSINIPAIENKDQTDYCGLVSGKITDKSKIFHTFYGELGTAPMIDDFPVNYECKYTGKSMEFAMDTFYFAEVHQVYAAEELLTDGKKWNPGVLNPLLLGSDNMYWSLGKKSGQAFKDGRKYNPESK